MSTDVEVRQNMENSARKILGEIETDFKVVTCFCGHGYAGKESRTISKDEFFEILKADNPIGRNKGRDEHGLATVGILMHRFKWFFRILNWNKLYFSNRDALKGFDLYLETELARPFIKSTYNEITARCAFLKCLKNQIDIVLSQIDEDYQKEIINSEN